MFRIMISGKLKSDISLWIQEFLDSNFYPAHLHAQAMRDDLPVDYLLNREIVGGLYFAQKSIFDFFTYIHHVYSTCMTTDVMIIYNADNPTELVENLLLTSKRVLRLFAVCLKDADQTTLTESLCNGTSVACIMFRFIIQGFMRVMTKDR